MVVKISQNKNGVTSFTMTSLADKSDLPTTGIATLSTAVFPNHGDTKVFVFTASDNGTPGTWDEMQ